MICRIRKRKRVVPREEVPHRSHVSRTPAQARQTKTKVTKTEIGPELDGA